MKDSTKTHLEIAGVLICLALLVVASNIGSADDYNLDAKGHGNITSEVRLGDSVGSNTKATDSDIVIGIQLTAEDNVTKLFSGMKLNNGTGGQYRVWGLIGPTSHSISVRNATDIFGTMSIKNEQVELEDIMNETTGYDYAGQSSLNITFTGEATEQVVSEGGRGQPVDLSSTKYIGMFEIKSEVII